MSADAIMARIGEIQSMCAQFAPAAVTQATQSSFADQLSSATATQSATTDPTAATDPTATAATATPATTAPTSTTGTQFANDLPSTTPYADQITAAAQKYGLDPALLAGLIKQESGFNPTIGSSAGAVGLTQLMPGTASSLGVTDRTDPAQSIDAGAHYLSEQLTAFGGNVSDALAAYNAGPGAVQQYGGIPPYAETQNYVRDVLANADQFRGATTTT